MFLPGQKPPTTNQTIQNRLIMKETRAQLQLALQALDPQYKALRTVISALKSAEKLTAADSADALPMHKTLTKLETAATTIDSPELDIALTAFGSETQTALDNLAFDFAKELRSTFAARGETVTGRPPVLSVGMLTFAINIAARKGQWQYGKEMLTRPIPLSLTGILKAYDQQVKRIVSRTIDAPAFLEELHSAWQKCIDKRKQRPQGGRINIVELHSEVTLGRQSARFWNAPSRSTFKDYDRVLFVRDLVILRETETLTLTVADEKLRLRLGVATKSQADQSSKSMWIPDSATDGQYHSDITFD